MQRFVGCLVLCLCALPVFADDDEPVVYQISDIVEAFESNAAALDENYLNKKLQVMGVVRRVTRATQKSKDDAAEYVIELEANSYGPSVGYSPYHPAAHPEGRKIEFRCSAKERKNLASLRRGMYVTLEGTCKQTDAALSFLEARLIKVHEAHRSPAPPGIGPGLPSAYTPIAPSPIPPLAAPMAVPGFAPVDLPPSLPAPREPPRP